MIPTEPSISGKFVADPHEEETSSGAAMLRGKITVRPEVRDPDGTYRRLPPTDLELLMFGVAAEHALRHFRAGDQFIASGQMRTNTFVAARIGHDSRWTTYRVVRSNRRRRRPTARAGRNQHVDTLPRAPRATAAAQGR
ncbi:hypothetical protein Xcel_0798 [Xylanimonas cellulosilytica DSM 15894]|uniref:Single-stranded DNA-binding protein n=1 Tax=Xylanimonas cellulosilytica (strain DSM 15894 / JCM 12276 / CECT 5975 / KCTC 9989 / LMG 20990 / NBRC 107835 / XIL07) TaxID=446471 RepID=D1BXM6_XYLCX|nr:single-stranded DNA-binding protein [Xylanimonas cellulosilytica]ACZ29836.1 hypothetical protein Xcel_0798 [Xylanimonas cellulosilytica DSM 15894]